MATPGTSATLVLCSSKQPLDQLQRVLHWQLGRFSIRQFVDYRYIDGDTTGSTSARLLELDKQYSSGLIADYYIEPTAFVRMRFSSGAYRSFLISLAREF